ncbi:MAG: hypothetical protein DHS20C11_30110 [Lysobacteraceae bacterium]|nr:MAG: hypothetical protein DHS20C11_30110 [Xanthomonadaceae bacterium]
MALLKSYFAAGMAIVLVAACATDQERTNEAEANAGNQLALFPGQIAPLLEGMGWHDFEISTSVPMAKTFFNQAIALTYGFNHLEAHRSYQQVAALDPNSAMAYWGQALVLGPNINAPMEAESVMTAFDAIEKAKSLSRFASQREIDLITALSTRYSQDETLADRAELDAAYALAMQGLVEQYPNDPNVRTLLAEALMVIHAWDYWNSDGRPKEWTPKILDVLETGLADYPSHAGLIHYYIHAVEASKQPGRALAAADTLRDLVPGAGHLVHMPSHIYIRTGRYQDGVIANEKAIKVDNNYIAQCRQQGIYPVAYVPHNRHFLWAMASMQGSSKKAIAAATHMAGHIDQQLMREEGYGTLQHYWVTPMYAYVRFGHWREALAVPKPEPDLKYPVAVWHYAQGAALTAMGDLDAAATHLSELQSLAADESLQEITVWQINDAYSVINIAALVLEGELASKAGMHPQSIASFEKAITLEDSLNYNEPSDWHYPVRQSLGAVLLQAGRYANAERIYRQDLETFPDNGWSLFGLHQALVMQGKQAEAELVRQRFEASWRFADIVLTDSVVH